MQFSGYGAKKSAEEDSTRWRPVVWCGYSCNVDKSSGPQKSLLKQCTFLGFQIGARGRAVWTTKAYARFKRRVKEITRRNRGHRVQDVIDELRVYVTGWLHYFGISHTYSALLELGGMGTPKSAVVLLEAMETAPDSPPPSDRLGYPTQGGSHGHAKP